MLTFEGLRQVRDDSAIERMTLMVRTAKLVRPDLPRIVYDVLRCEPRETRTTVPGHPAKMKDRIESRLNDPDERTLLDLIDIYALDDYVQGLPRKDNPLLPDEDRTLAWFTEYTNVNAELREPLRRFVKVATCQHQCYHAGHGLPWGIRMTVPTWTKVLETGRKRFDDLVWWTGPEEWYVYSVYHQKLPSAYVLKPYTTVVKEVYGDALYL